MRQILEKSLQINQTKFQRFKVHDQLAKTGRVTHKNSIEEDMK
jgi:hypothetical protein